MKSAQVKIMLLLSTPLSSWGVRFTTRGPQDLALALPMKPGRELGPLPDSRPLHPKSVGCMFLESLGSSFLLI
jgi:hypothetical protein